MANKNDTARRERLVNSTFSELDKINKNPIDGYQNLPLLSLEAALEPIKSLLPDVEKYATIAKEKCNRTSHIVTVDESAVLYLYTMQTPLFSTLNEALRAENRHELKPWFSFLKLFLTALNKLPSEEMVVWRGIISDIGSNALENTVQIWWSVNSCSRSLKVVEFYLGSNNTVFAIDASYGKDISTFSAYPDEMEMVLMPGTRLRVMSAPLDFQSVLSIVYLKEEPPTRENRESENQKRDDRMATPLHNLEKSVICDGHVCPTCRRCCDWKRNGQSWIRVSNDCNHSGVKNRVSGFSVAVSRIFKRQEPPRVHVVRNICDCK